MMFALLTELSLILTLITLGVGILYAARVDSQSPGSRLQKIYSALFTVCISAETMVFIAYWTLMSWWHFPNYIAKCPSQAVCHYFNLMVHGFPTLLMWFMALVEPTEIRKRHGFYLVGFTLFFAACHIPYAMKYGPVYKHLDFNSITGYLGVCVGYSILYFSYKLYKLVASSHKRLKKNTPEHSPKDSPISKVSNQPSHPLT